MLLSTRAQTREMMQQEIIAYLQSLPDWMRWRDFFEASTGKLIIDLLTGISELLLYKLEVRSLDSYLLTAISPNAVYLLSQMVGYNPNRKRCSTGIIRLRFQRVPDTTFSIPDGYPINYSIPLVIRGNHIINPGTETIDLPVLQGEWVTVTFSTENNNLIGKEWEILIINEKDFQVDQFEIYVQLNGELLEVVDRIEKVGRKSVLIRTDYHGGVFLIFGDGTFGARLYPNSVVTVRYLRTLGRKGVIYTNTQLGQYIYSKYVFSAIVVQSILGGSDEDEIDKVKYLASRFFQTQGRAVTQYDYEAIIMSFPGVISAKARRIDEECCVICISALKDSARSAESDGSWSQLEIDDLLAYLEDYKMISTKVVFWQPVPIDLNVSVKIIVPPMHLTQEVEEEVRKIIEKYCYQLGKPFRPTELIDLITDHFPFIRRSYILDVSKADDECPYQDIELKCNEYFRLKNVIVTKEIET